MFELAEESYAVENADEELKNALQILFYRTRKTALPSGLPGMLFHKPDSIYTKPQQCFQL